MLRPSRTILFFLLATIFLALVGQTSGAPVSTARRSSITPRQDKQSGGGVFQGPHVVHTTKTTNTELGPVTEDCEITLTPESNGLVREDKVCTVTLRPNGTNAGNSGGNSSNSGSGSASDIGSSSTSDVGSSSSDTGAAASPSNTGQAAASATDSTQATASANGSSSASATAASPSGSAAATTTTSSSASSSATTTSSASPSAATSPSAGGQTNGTPTTTAGSSADSAQVSPAAAPSSTSAQAEQSSPTSTGFSLPGQKLSVLPIGLGVFAGISVIALIVVGLVTYERTKYRKAFRQRKLAEQGQTPAYGGMAERPA